MEALSELWQGIADWWSGLPALPETGLPAAGDPDLLIVIATVLMALGLTAMLSAWVDKRRSWVGIVVVLLATAMFAWAWESDRAAFGWIRIPEAFVEMIARALR